MVSSTAASAIRTGNFREKLNVSMSQTRLAGEKHETWLTGKSYFDMTEFQEWQDEQYRQKGGKVRSMK